MIACPEPRRYQPSTDRPAVLDVGERREDVISLARSHASLWAGALRLGWDPDDLEQELLIRVHARQSMASRYDPERAGVGKYLFVLTRSILLNLVEMRQSAKARAESVGCGRDVALDARSLWDGDDLDERIDRRRERRWARRGE